MGVATFDTLKAAEALEEAGVGEAQAEAAVAMVRDAVTEGVATKTDIAGLEARFFPAMWIQPASSSAPSSAPPASLSAC